MDRGRAFLRLVIGIDLQRFGIQQQLQNFAIVRRNLTRRLEHERDFFARGYVAFTAKIAALGDQFVFGVYLGQAGIIEPVMVPEILAEVDELSEQVKGLAMNLAIYLAKLKSRTKSDHFSRLEPEFIRLVNGTIKVVQEVATIINAASNRERLAWEIPSGGLNQDQIEIKLHGILEQCTRVTASLHQARDLIV